MSTHGGTPGRYEYTSINHVRDLSIVKLQKKFHECNTFVIDKSTAGYMYQAASIRDRGTAAPRLDTPLSLACCAGAT